jgi:photosystem II stability/assembly factor-like uncharacterized protein
MARGFGGAVGRIRSSRRGGFALLVVVAFVAAAASASLVAELRATTPVQVGGKRRLPTTTLRIPAAGAVVPAYDLTSDPVFPTLSLGYAIESHATSAGTTEHLARSKDGGQRWYLVGAPFPFSSGYAQVQFESVRTGYAFGRAGLAVTHDGGRTWQAGASLGGILERVVPIGANVWATYAVCHGPPEADTVCRLRLAVSKDAGLSWQTAGRSSPLTEAMAGGDILARDTLEKAYVVSYGPTGGGLAVTADAGRTWRELPDPCSFWRRADMAALAGGQLWMICGGPPVLGGKAEAKAVLRSFDAGRHWRLESSTGFGPALTHVVNPSDGVVGQLDYGGQLSQLATISPLKAWIGVSELGVLVTSDAGKTWSLAEGFVRQKGPGGVGVTFDDALHGWAIEFSKGVWYTADGLHWRRIDGH